MRVRVSIYVETFMRSAAEIRAKLYMMSATAPDRAVRRNTAPKSRGGLWVIGSTGAIAVRYIYTFGISITRIRSCFPARRAGRVHGLP